MSRATRCGFMCTAPRSTQRALNRTLEGHVVNVSDDAPTTFFEPSEPVGERLEPSPEPLTNPWHMRMDNTLARGLGYRPAVNDIHQAVLERLL